MAQLKTSIAALGFLAAFAAAPALAQDAAETGRAGAAAAAEERWEEAHELMSQAALAAWQEMPLQVADWALVAEPAEGFGMYEARPDNRYSAGEPILIYVALIGFAHEPAGEAWRYGIGADFLIRGEGGRIVGGQEGFMQQDFESRTPNREFFVDLRYSVTGIEPGNYLFETRFHDRNSDKEVLLETPIVVVE